MNFTSKKTNESIGNNTTAGTFSVKTLRNIHISKIEYSLKLLKTFASIMFLLLKQIANREIEIKLESRY
jgi:hypothetical protein